ncbi:MAG: META domain-containing protein [Gammaproteobacteria bacterium]|nr:META domain-containing protein [Gammaproteobacteria bacterium]MBL4728583.1 META domain-containing protein [Gammaproteobacteria bacterium]
MKKILSRHLVLGTLLTLILSSAQFSLAQEEDITLEGSNWQLLNMKVLGGFLFTPDDPSLYRLNFRSENRLTGASDCNTITGSYFQDSTGFLFDPFVSTRKLCAPGSLHNNLVLILRNVNAIEFRDGKMYMTNGYDGVELEFEEREF